MLNLKADELKMLQHAVHTLSHVRCFKYCKQYRGSCEMVIIRQQRINTGKEQLQAKDMNDVQSLSNRCSKLLNQLNCFSLIKQWFILQRVT